MKKPIEEFIETIARLRGPNGCPWDREQTHKTLKRYLIEETYEAVDAMENDDSQELMEELGDVLLQIVLHSQIAAENKTFTFDDVAKHVNNKMISRHPHVFGDLELKTADEVLANWDDFKKQEKPNREVFEGIPNSLPALLKALKVSKKVTKYGFDWEDKNHLLRALDLEYKEVQEAFSTDNKEHQMEELGDLLLMLVNLARFNKIDPEESLNKSIKKFTSRFNSVKNLSNDKLKELSPTEIQKLWETVKEHEQK